MCMMNEPMKKPIQRPVSFIPKAVPAIVRMAAAQGIAMGGWRTALPVASTAPYSKELSL
jgi:hypothetical protein